MTQKESTGGVDDLDRRIGAILFEFYDSMKLLERDPHRDGKQAVALIMAIHDIKAAANNQSA